MKVKGVIRQWEEYGLYYPTIYLHRNWRGVYTRKSYATPHAAKAAAERFAKQLNLEIEWEVHP